MPMSECPLFCSTGSNTIQVSFFTFLVFLDYIRPRRPNNRLFSLVPVQTISSMKKKKSSLVYHILDTVGKKIPILKTSVEMWSFLSKLIWTVTDPRRLSLVFNDRYFLTRNPVLKPVTNLMQFWFILTCIQCWFHLILFWPVLNTH